VTNEKVDLLVRGCLVVTMDPQRRVIENGYVAVRGSEIVAVGDDARPGGPGAGGSGPAPDTECFRASETIDAPGCAVIPGLVNAHTHAAMTIMRGMADDMRLAEWLNEHIWPTEAEFVTPDFIRAGTSLAALEMLSGGVTTYGDMYFFQEDAAQAAAAIGIRAVLGEVLLDFPTASAATPAEGIAYQRAFNARHAADPLIFGCVMPHAPYSCSEAVLRDSKALAREQKVVWLIHLAETADELAQVAERAGGLSPVAYLDSLGLLDEMTTGAHAVWLTDSDIAILAERGCSTVHCPESNMKLASGMAPVVEQRTAGVNVAIGTDGAASNNDLSVFREMDTAAKLAKVRLMDPAALPAHEVFEMATLGGARALGLGGLIGSIEVGKRADLAVIDLSAPHLVPLYDIYSHLVYACDSSDVMHTVVDGKVVMRGRDIATVDVSAVVEEVEEIAARIKASERARRG
jgi:5-methylthioadenosine/S-adenosylhomocysteine deaminase